MRLSKPLLALVPVLAVPSLASAQSTSAMSVDSAGVLGNKHSDCFKGQDSMTPDGSLVVVSSYASNLVSGDTNGFEDVFVHDRTTGQTERVSVDSSGGQANSWSFNGQISADGRYVVFTSYATNLVSTGANGYAQVYVHDRVTGATELVSVDSAGNTGNKNSGDEGSYISPLAISADGRYVAFTSLASNLAPFDTNNTWDVFVRDRTSGTTAGLTVAGDLDSHCQGMSADGRYVVFYSNATNLFIGDSNASADVFVCDCSIPYIHLVSVDSSGSQGNSTSQAAAISADGEVVVFASLASNLVWGDTNGVFDIFVNDLSAGVTERVSVDSAGVEGNLDSDTPVISADHRFVAFASKAYNLVGGDSNGAQSDIFVHDRISGKTGLASVNSSGTQSDDRSFDPAISADGQLVLFDSYATNLVPGDGNKVSDVFLRDRCDAVWSNYGSGYPGSNGVPAFDAQADPVLGTTLTLGLGNSLGLATPAVLLVGYQRASIPTGRGGDILVVSAFIVPINVPSIGTTISGPIANDPALCGTTIDLQAIEVDAGSNTGLSFTEGLELMLGR
jgi:hypothetical protein